jgi:hypothetical protein
MKKQRLYFFLMFLFLVMKSFSQGFLLTQPRLQFNGNQLQIFYDIITKNPEDNFYIWIEMKKANGDIIIAKNLSGDIGDDVKAGNNKKIVWIPERDSIILDEEISVVLKAEKYTKSFNKGSMMLRSMVFPGWGQTKISKGKPWWITGIVFYGTMAGDYFCYHSYFKNYDAYKIEEDPLKRNDYKKEAQQQLNYATTLFYSAAALWAINVFWVAATPNRDQLLQHINLSFMPSQGSNNVIPLLSIRLDF